MSRLKTISFTAVILVVAATCTGLGWWQLNRLSQRRSANRESLAARTAPIVDLAEELPSTLVGRRVTVEGRYDRDRAFVLRSRPYRGNPGVQLVVPLLMEGDTAVLVNLGFVPAADAVHVDRKELRLPAGDTVIGLAMELVANPGWGQAVVSRGDTTWRHMEASAVASRLPYPFLPVVVVKAPSDTAGGFPRALPFPPLDDGPHLSYAIQWFSFAAIALIGGMLWIRKHLLEE